MYQDDHHGDGRLALWCAAPSDAQVELVSVEPDRSSVPPHVGHRGWLGVRLDRDMDCDLDCDEITGIVCGAYRQVAPISGLESRRVRPPGRGPAVAATSHGVRRTRPPWRPGPRRTAPPAPSPVR